MSRFQVIALSAAAAVALIVALKKFDPAGINSNYLKL